jgi:hypothetical protein
VKIALLAVLFERREGQVFSISFAHTLKAQHFGNVSKGSHMPATQASAGEGRETDTSSFANAAHRIPVPNLCQTGEKKHSPSRIRLIGHLENPDFAGSLAS